VARTVRCKFGCFSKLDKRCFRLAAAHKRQSEGVAQRSAPCIQGNTLTQNLFSAPFFTEPPQYIGEVDARYNGVRLDAQRLLIKTNSFSNILLVQLKRGERS